jgi:hypothetical protein
MISANSNSGQIGSRLDDGEAAHESVEVAKDVRQGQAVAFQGDLARTYGVDEGLRAADDTEHGFSRHGKSAIRGGIYASLTGANGAVIEAQNPILANISKSEV